MRELFFIVAGYLTGTICLFVAMMAFICYDETEKTKEETEDIAKRVLFEIVLGIISLSYAISASMQL